MELVGVMHSKLLLLCKIGGSSLFIIMILSFQILMSGQKVLTQIRLLLADQGLHCLPFCLHLLDPLLYGKAALFKFKGDYSKFFGVRIFRIFTVFYLNRNS